MRMSVVFPVVAVLIATAMPASAAGAKSKSDHLEVKGRDHMADVAVDRAHRDVRDHRGRQPVIRDRLANPCRNIRCRPKKRRRVRDHRDGQ